MDAEGPPLEALIHRLCDTPADFLAAPRIGGSGAVDGVAVVADLFRLLGIEPTAQDLSTLERAQGDRNPISVQLILCWLLADDWFKSVRPDATLLRRLFFVGARQLSEHTQFGRFVADPERREEMARWALAWLGFRPQGETLAQAQDRLMSLSAAERARVMAASPPAAQRARAVREAPARKAAEEAADKWSRE